MAKRKLPKTNIVCTPEQLKQGDIVERYDPAAKQTALYNRKNSTISFYFYRKKPLITYSQKQAADFVASAYIIGWQGKSSCEVKQRVDGSKHTIDFADNVISAKRRYRRAMKAAGRFGYVVHKVAVEDRSIASMARSGSAKSKMMQELREGLDLIAKEFGFYAPSG